MSQLYWERYVSRARSESPWPPARSGSAGNYHDGRFAKLKASSRREDSPHPRRTGTQAGAAARRTGTVPPRRTGTVPPRGDSTSAAVASRCPPAAETQVAVPTRESSRHFAAASAARPPRCRRIERNTCQCTGWTRGATGRTDASTGGVVRRSCPPDAGRCPVPCARTRSTGRGAVMCKPR
jgi:hypothetical protein